MQSLQKRQKQSYTLILHVNTQACNLWCVQWKHAGAVKHKWPPVAPRGPQRPPALPHDGRGQTEAALYKSKRWRCLNLKSLSLVCLWDRNGADGSVCVCFKDKSPAPLSSVCTSSSHCISTNPHTHTYTTDPQAQRCPFERAF